MATLKIQGREASAAEASDLLDSPLHQVEKDHVVVVGGERAADAPIEIPDAQPDDLVELHLDDGAVVVSTYAWLRERVAQIPGQRGGDPELVPVFLGVDGAERGVGTVALRLLRLFRVEPHAAIADLATEKAIARIEGQLGGRPGLYRLAADGSLAERSSQPLAASDSGAPLLLFLHGTASSTMGSFGGLFGERRAEQFAPSAEWRALRDRYGDRIFALEHNTLSVSPARNALDLAELLPPRAEVHLISHSRGGLVGELICRGGFGREDLAVFRRGDREQKAPDEMALLEALGAELRRKEIRVERFARVACPAAGTVLASDRLDLFLSVLLSLLKHAATPVAEPVMALLEATLLEVARRRADPAELPGLEAQRPESPYAHFLNRPQASVDQDLCVIAGDLRRGNVLQSLRALVGYGFFWQKNDLVVHTRAMYAGLPRKKAWVSFHEGAAVTHFSYFREAPSRERLLAAIARPSRDTTPEGFQGLAEALETQSFSVMRDLPGRERGQAAAAGTVLFVPDLLATRLLAGGVEVWPSVAALSQGGLGALQAGNAVGIGELVDTSAVKALSQALGAAYTVEPVPYDWRGGSVEAARALGAALSRRAPGSAPVSIVAHGLGALGVLELLRERAAAGGTDPLPGVPILLAAPPLHGAEAALELWLGEGRLFRMLCFLDEGSTPSDIVGVLRGLPAVAELLPDRALEPTSWEEAGLAAPDPTQLAAVEQRRDEHAAIARRLEASFLLGTAEATQAITFTEPRRVEPWEEGDGWMVNPVTLLPPARVWFAPALHERLLAHPLGAAAAADLLRNGTTSRAARQAPRDRPRRQPPPLVFPSQSDLDAELLAADAGDAPASEWILKVEVAHGSLDRLETRALLVGHHNGDAIFGAEAFLDECMEGRLGERMRLGNYPGAAGTGTYVAAPGCNPPAALVVGLGEVGELTAGVLASSVERAVLEYALRTIEERVDRLAPETEPIPLPLASLLVGTRGGQLSLRQAMVAILRGIIRAHRALAVAGLDRFVALDDLVFVELWSDIAIAAGHALLRLEDDAGLGRQGGERVLPATTVRSLEGGRGNSRAYESDWLWWRRVIVSEEDVGDGRSGLRFVTLGERSRAEERLLFTQRPMVDELLERAPRSGGAGDAGGVVNALFELLLPVSLKETVFEGRDLVLVVDRSTGRYPWELLARRTADGIEPVVSRVRVVRQLKTPSFREGSAAVRSSGALVIGEPAVSGLVSLPGARNEAMEVIKALQADGRDVEVSVGEAGNEVVRKLFLRDYRLIHVAAHGDYKAGKPGESGVIIGRNDNGTLSVLSADIFRQLRTVPEVVFLNCCHLGRLDAAGPNASGVVSDADRARLAASVAEAIMELGVRALVVAGWAVEDTAATTFAREFYERLLGGESFGEAVHEARCAVWARHKMGTTWGAYQCYGDPAFRLGSSGAAAREPRVFVSAGELLGEIADVAADATSTGRSRPRRERIEERLGAIETFLAGQPAWRTGQVVHALADAWREIGSHPKAASLYREALVAMDGLAPLRAAERLANVLDRLDRDGEAPPTVAVEAQALLEQAAGEARTPAAIAWLDWVDAVGRSAERASLRGGFLKRAAGREKDEAKRQELLRGAAKSYSVAVELGRRASGTVHYYSGLNAAALAWATGPPEDGDKGARKLVRELVAPSRRSAKLERQRSLDLWNSIADCEADLIEALLLDTLDDPTAQKLRGRYKRALAKGSPSQHDSVRGQLDFLVSCAVGSRQRFRQGLQTILTAFDKE